jgi:hypothetical protein
MSNTKAKTEKVTIHVNNQPLHFTSQDIPAAEIKAAAGIPASNLLFLEVPGPGDDVAIANDAVVHLEPGQHYYDMPPGNFGGY